MRGQKGESVSKHGKLKKKCNYTIYFRKRKRCAILNNTTLATISSLTSGIKMCEIIKMCIGFSSWSYIILSYLNSFHTDDNVMRCALVEISFLIDLGALKMTLSVTT